MVASGGTLAPGETLQKSIRRHLASKVDVRELSDWSRSRPSAPPTETPQRELATANLGLIPPDVARPSPPTRTGIRSRASPARLRPQTDHPHRAGAPPGKLSYTNLGSPSPPPNRISELRDIYSADLGHEVSATNLQRILLRRQVIKPTEATSPETGKRRTPSSPLQLRPNTLEVTDPFAVLRRPAN